MYNVQRPVGLRLFNNARNVDLASACGNELATCLDACERLRLNRRTLRDHLDVDAILTQNTEETATDADHATQLAADKTNDGQARDKVNITPDAEVINGTLEGSRLDLDFFRIGSSTGQESNLRMQGHGYVDLGRGDEVNRQVPLVEDGEDGHEETVCTGTLLRMHVKHGDATLDSDSGGTLGTVLGAEADQAAVAEKTRLLASQVVSLVGPDDGSLVARVFDVLDTNGNAGFDDLIHGEGVNNFGTVKGQLGGLGRSDRGQQASGGHLARVGSKDTIDFLPDLQLRGANSDSDQSGAKVGVATADLGEEAARDVSKVTGNDGNGITTGKDRLCERGCQVAVEIVVDAFADGEVDDITQVDILGVAAAILQHSRHVQT